MPVSTINPNDIFLLGRDSTCEPMYSRRLTTMTWSHDDKTFLLEFLIHHFDLTIDGHKYLRIDIILTHLFHHGLHEIIDSSVPLIMLTFLSILEFISGFSGLRHYYITHSAKSTRHKIQPYLQHSYTSQQSLEVNQNKGESFDVGLHLDWFKLEVGDYYTYVISTEFQIWEVTNFRGVLFVTIVLLPSRLTLINECTRSSLSIFVLIDETTHFSRCHHIPASIWPNHNEFICILKFKILDFWFRNQSNSFGLEISQWTCYSNSRSFFVCPNSRRSYLLPFMSQSINFTTRFLYPFSLIRSNRFMIIRKFNCKFFFHSLSKQNSPWISQVGNITFVALKQDRNCTCSWTWVINATTFQLFLCIFKYFWQVVFDILFRLDLIEVTLMCTFL